MDYLHWKRNMIQALRVELAELGVIEEDIEGDVINIFEQDIVGH